MLETISKLGEHISGILQKGIVLENCQNLVALYNGEDWLNYVQYKPDNYNKILVWNDSLLDIYLICWKSGQKSPIHDHPNNGCIMRVMTGLLEETKYINLKNIEKYNCNTGSIKFIVGDKELHSICPIVDSVSLHIYSPPNYKANIYQI